MIWKLWTPYPVLTVCRSRSFWGPWGLMLKGHIRGTVVHSIQMDPIVLFRGSERFHAQNFPYISGPRIPHDATTGKGCKTIGTDAFYFVSQ